ncbi:MAG: histidine kinase [Oscillospiraceae bacterium]|nr:histidine kinase [Oscillospiraceae bacterium]
MTRRIYYSIIYTCLGVLLLSMLLTLLFLYAHFDASLTEELRVRAEYLCTGTEKYGVEFLQTLPEEDDRITLVGKDGTVLFDNRVQAGSMENHAARDEIAQAMSQGEGSAQRRSDTMAEKTCYYAVRLSDGSVLRLAKAQATVWALVGRMVPLLLTAAVFLVLLCAVLAENLSRGIMHPISTLDPKAPPVKEDIYEELGPLVARLQDQNSRIAAQMEELGRRQREFAVLADNMSEGMLLIDANAEVLLCNASMAAFFQRPGGAVGHNVLLLNRSRDFCRVVGDALKGQRSSVQLTVNGRLFELLADPVFGGTEQERGGAEKPDDTGRLTGAVLLMVDITERAERERLRREFTANVSHELKTPLTAIHGSAELLAGGIVKPEDIPGFAQDIYAQSGRMIRLVEDILRLSQLDAGGIAMKKESVDLLAAAKQVTDELADAAARAQVTLTLQGERAELQGVPAILHELIANLCDNAIKYNRPGGSVCVRVGVQNDSGREIPFVEVTDTGIGIPKEHQSRVFERFYRVDKSHSRRIGGTGLGLSIVKHAALMHGGRILLQSEPDKGTSIRVCFTAE